MFKLFIGKADQCFERGLISESVIAGDVGHFCANETLTDAEHVGVSTSLDLREQTALGIAQRFDAISERKTIGQELVGGVKIAAAYDVPFDIPTNTLGHFDAFGVALGVDGLKDMHGCISV